MVVKYNTGLKTHMERGILESICYGNWIYKFKWIVWKHTFTDQFNTITKRYKNGLYFVLEERAGCLTLKPDTHNETFVYNFCVYHTLLYRRKNFCMQLHITCCSFLQNYAYMHLWIYCQKLLWSCQLVPL